MLLYFWGACNFKLKYEQNPFQDEQFLYFGLCNGFLFLGGGGLKMAANGGLTYPFCSQSPKLE